MCNETILGKVFLGGIKTGRLPDRVARWLDDAMECGENFVLSDENTLPNEFKITRRAK